MTTSWFVSFDMSSACSGGFVCGPISGCVGAVDGVSFIWGAVVLGFGSGSLGLGVAGVGFVVGFVDVSGIGLGVSVSVPPIGFGFCVLFTARFWFE